MLLVGLTGNIASGKSTVSRLLAERGATIIDADVLARQAVQIGTPAHSAIVRRWGNAVLAPDGVLDRAALRERVFTDHEQLEELNAIVHPQVASMRDRLVNEARARGDRIVVCDIPLLFERHLAGEFDRIVLVDAPRPTRLERLVRDRRLREDEAMNMITAQMPAELKRARADFVLDNNGTRSELEAAVGAVWAALSSEADERAGGSALLRDRPAADAEVPRTAADGDGATVDARQVASPPAPAVARAAGAAGAAEQPPPARP